MKNRATFEPSRRPSSGAALVPMPRWLAQSFVPRGRPESVENVASIMDQLNQMTLWFWHRSPLKPGVWELKFLEQQFTQDVQRVVTWLLVRRNIIRFPRLSWRKLTVLGAKARVDQGTLSGLGVLAAQARRKVPFWGFRVQFLCAGSRCGGVCVFALGDHFSLQARLRETSFWWSKVDSAGDQGSLMSMCIPVDISSMKWAALRPV